MLENINDSEECAKELEDRRAAIIGVEAVT